MSPRPVLLSVDDDPAVGRALGRDLRRHYGETHRVVRADDGGSALAALRDLALRGEQVALLLADYRMPGMTGVEFLEQAMDVAPRARRVLLTAYADTDAAIRAINDVDLDRYLLKPWDPPEERLYPALDDLLLEWASDNRPTFEGITVLGDQWSTRTQALKEFLARNAVPFRHLDVRSEAGARLLEAAQRSADPADLPVVLLADGEVLVRPSLPQLADRVGLSTTAGHPFYDLVVIGGGPAGLGSAVYGSSEGLNTLLVERTATGGQAGQSSRIENYLGFPSGLSGADLAQRARSQALRFGVEILTAVEAVGIEEHGDGRVVRFADGSAVTALAVVLATGVSYTRMQEPVDAFAGRGLYYGAAAHEALNCKDQDVYVVGGANSAGQAALFFTRYARRVVVLVRGADLRTGMSEYLVNRIEAEPGIEVRTRTEVVGAAGDEHLEQIVLRDGTDGSLETVPASWLFVLIGAAPRTDWLGTVLVRDARGFVLTGPDLLDADQRPPAGWPLARDPYLLESSMPGVFVAGDVRAASVKRVASAVGEGAMAVFLVHRHLEETR